MFLSQPRGSQKGLTYKADSLKVTNGSSHLWKWGVRVGGAVSGGQAEVPHMGGGGAGPAGLGPRTGGSFSGDQKAESLWTRAAGTRRKQGEKAGRPVHVGAWSPGPPGPAARPSPSKHKAGRGPQKTGCRSEVRPVDTDSEDP